MQCSAVQCFETKLKTCQLSITNLCKKLGHVPEGPDPGVEVGVQGEEAGVLPGQHVVQGEVGLHLQLLVEQLHDGHLDKLG